MTIINPNSIAGITSLTAEADVMNFYKSDGTFGSLQLNGCNFNTTNGISTFNNLVVGGTLTYEDVKNVDSVGIITARGGLNVTANTDTDTLNVSGVSTFVGNAKFNTLSGSGAIVFSTGSGVLDDSANHSISGSTLNTVDIVAQGNITVADKIIHRSDTNTTIRFPSNDTITAETDGSERLRLGSVGEIQIGTTSWPTGTMAKAAGRVLVGGGGDLTLWNETNSAGGVASFKLACKEGGDATKIGYVQFFGGTENTSDQKGFLKVNVSDASGSGQERLRIASNGEITQTAASGNTVITLKRSNTNTTGTVGGINFAALDGHSVASIQSRGDGNDEGAHLQFYTTSAAAGDMYNAANIERVRITSSGDLYVGNGAGYAIWDNASIRPRFQFRQTTGDNRGFALLEERGDANCINLYISKSRGGNGAGVIVSGDSLGSINFTGADGTNQVTGAQILAWTGGTIAADRIPTHLSFYTHGDNTSGALERLRLTSDGELRHRGSSSNLGQGDVVAKYTHHTLDPTTPGGAGEVFKIYTYSANANGADYSTWLYKRAGSAGGECGIRLGGSADGSLNFYTSPNSSTAYAERLRIANDGEVFIGPAASAITDRSTLLSVTGTNQDPTGVWTQVGLYSNDSQAADKGGSIGFGGQDGSTAKQQFAAIKGAKENGTSGNYAGYMAFYTRPAGAVSAERLRITSTGIVSIGGLAPNISAVKGLEISGGATAEIRLKNSGGGTGQADGFAIQKWSNGNNYIYDYDSNNILFGTSNVSRTQMDTSGRWTFSPSGAITSGSTTIAMSIINNGGTAVSGNAYPGIAFKSTASGGGNGMALINYDANFDLYTRSGNRQGLGILHSNSASSGNAVFTAGHDGKVTLGPDLNASLSSSRYCNTALHVVNGGVSIGCKGDSGGTHWSLGGRYVLGWYAKHNANTTYYHIKTDLWGGGSPHGNTEYIMGGFVIHGYGYGQGVSEQRHFFHNWGGSFHGRYTYNNTSGWNPGVTTYVSSDGFVVLRLNGGNYVSYVIDLIQMSNYDVRDIQVTGTSNSSSGTAY